MAASDQSPHPPFPSARRARAIVIAAFGVAIGLAAAGADWRLRMRPRMESALKRHQTMLDIATLYGLQLSYKRKRGTYADDLDSLLSSSADGAALKARLAANTDAGTIVVAGDADKFRIELNVRDPERTLIKARGPVESRRPSAETALPLPAAPMNADGAPIATGR